MMRRRVTAGRRPVRQARGCHYTLGRANGGWSETDTESEKEPWAEDPEHKKPTSVLGP
jgi:hypothetical protein